MLRFFFNLQLSNFQISHIYSKYINSFHEQYISNINSLVAKKKLYSINLELWLDAK